MLDILLSGNKNHYYSFKIRSALSECKDTLALATAMRALERMVWHISDKSPISLMLLYKSK